MKQNIYAEFILIAIKSILFPEVNLEAYMYLSHNSFPILPAKSECLQAFFSVNFLSFVYYKYNTN